MLSAWLYPFAIAFALLGSALIIMAFALIYIHKGKKNKKIKIFIIAYLVLGILFFTPLAAQKAINIIEKSVFKSLLYKCNEPFYEAIHKSESKNIEVEINLN